VGNLLDEMYNSGNSTTLTPLGIFAMPNLLTPRILVFDSGVGGLSVMREITRTSPHVHIIYASDNAAFPYGLKPEAELLERVTHVISKLIDKYQPSLVVIACNTASTIALLHLRTLFDTPFVGVVPAIKPAAEQSSSRVIGLLATPATVAREYTQVLINDYAADCTVIKIGSSRLVELAELKLRGVHMDYAADIAEILTPFTHVKHQNELGNGSRIDHIVLACTHFPLLREEILQAFDFPITLIDSGEAIARRVRHLLNSNHTSSKSSTFQPQHLAIFTKETSETNQLRTALATFGLHEITYLET
jgi:glutamate racemase